jgi:hypothetical protein
MNASDFRDIIIAALRGRYSVNSGSMDKRLTWAKYDTIGRLVIGIRPLRTAWFFVFKVAH